MVLTIIKCSLAQQIRYISYKLGIYYLINYLENTNSDFRIFKHARYLKL